jgi:site-specific DNA-methyltransferase (adenine-specific)
MIELHLGDCLEVMRGMPDKSVDAVITDPPYGINFKYASYEDTEDAWYELMNKALPEMRRIAKMVVLPSCAIKRLPWWYANHKPDWLIAWYKGSPGHLSAIGFNDWEPLIVYGKPFKQMHDYFQTRCGFDNNGHPCPKPVEWAKWLCTRVADENMTILDPFMGSGTTGVACVQTGRNFIGIEIDPTYFAIAERRIAEAQMQPRLEVEE